MRTASRRDNNERRIIAFLKRCGASVAQINEPGIPDLIVAWYGYNILVEIKGEKGKLTDAQLAFFAHWTGPACVVRSIKEMKEVLRMVVDGYEEVWVTELPVKPGEAFDAGWVLPLGNPFCPLRVVVVGCLPNHWCAYSLPKWTESVYASLPSHNANDPNKVRAHGTKVPEWDARVLFPAMKGASYYW